MEYQYANRMEIFGLSPIREVLKLAADPSYISLAAGSPSPASYPVKEMKEIMDRLMEEQPVRMLQYGVSEGYAPLQKALKDRMREKYQTGTDEDRILITSGAQQGIESFAKAFLNEGDGVICEDPSFISALNAIRCYNGARLIGIPVDDDGMRIDLLEEALKREKNIKFIYTINTFQNPTGVTMPLERRKQMLELAKKYHVMILEDAPYFELRYSGEYVPTLKSMDTDGIVAFVGSLSKIIAPGIRVGFLMAPQSVIKKVTKSKQIGDVHTSTLMQAMSCEFLTKYDVDAHIDRICKMYRESRDVMLEALSDIDERVRYTRPDGGLFLWAEMPEGYSAEELQDRMLEKGKVLMITGPAFAATPGRFTNCFRLNFSMPTHENIRRGVDVLKECVKEYLR
ncbi:PLP-dependent aminotransferase family protein [Hominifimenecus sp. rT4P-3]|uniref:aminotransferase-like domain-containing protein n=1 Tax=Hominifimenecus sp. rT4P-3 TaxID=3242979 RepID=UPI003DA1CF45